MQWDISYTYVVMCSYVHMYITSMSGYYRRLSVNNNDILQVLVIYMLVIYVTG